MVRMDVRVLGDFPAKSIPSSPDRLKQKTRGNGQHIIRLDVHHQTSIYSIYVSMWGCGKKQNRVQQQYKTPSKKK